MSAPPILATILAADRITARGIEAGCLIALCAACWPPGHDHCAALVAVWCDGRPSMRIASLAAGALLTTRDNKHGSPTIRRWTAPENAPARGAEARHASDTFARGTAAHPAGTHA